jgi:hypothetical protein
LFAKEQNNYIHIYYQEKKSKLGKPFSYMAKRNQKNNISTAIFTKYDLKKKKFLVKKDIK